jgi:GNAT superfamily N-acetyltransferase
VSPPFTLRSATESDIPDVLRLVRGLAEYEKLTQYMTATEADFARLLFGPRALGHAALAEVGAHPVGVALWYFTLNTFAGRAVLFVEDVFVEPAHRGSGIGLALFRHMARIALTEGCQRMEWSVLDWNAPSIEFYRRIGARPVEGWITQRLAGDALAALAEGAQNG